MIDQHIAGYETSVAILIDVLGALVAALGTRRFRCGVFAVVNHRVVFLGGGNAH